MEYVYKQYLKYSNIVLVSYDFKHKDKQKKNIKAINISLVIVSHSNYLLILQIFDIETFIPIICTNVQ